MKTQTTIGEWMERLEAAGFKVVSNVKKKNRVKFKINAELLFSNREIVKELFNKSIEYWKVVR